MIQQQVLPPNLTLNATKDPPNYTHKMETK